MPQSRNPQVFYNHHTSEVRFERLPASWFPDAESSDSMRFPRAKSGYGESNLEIVREQRTLRGPAPVGPQETRGGASVPPKSPTARFHWFPDIRYAPEGAKWGHALCSSAKLLSVSAAPVHLLRQRRLIHQPRLGARHERLPWVRIIKRKPPKGFHLNGRMMAAATLSGLLML